MARQTVTAFYNRANQNIYTDNTLVTITANGPALYQNNVSYVLAVNVYSSANTTAYYNCSDLTNYEFAIGNFQDPVITSVNGDINQAGDGSIAAGGKITIRINCTSDELTSELAGLNYKNYYGELRANTTSDIQTIAIIPITVRNTVL